mgnify:CR=1 FL=1
MCVNERMDRGQIRGIRTVASQHLEELAESRLGPIGISEVRCAVTGTQRGWSDWRADGATHETISFFDDLCAVRPSRAAEYQWRAHR